MNRVCEACQGALPLGSHSLRRFCIPCADARHRARERERWAEKMKHSRVQCRTCAKFVRGERYKTLRICMSCDQKVQRKLRVRRAPVREKRAPEVEVAFIENPDVIVKRVAASLGVEHATALVESMNSWRRRNGVPEVRL